VIRWNLRNADEVGLQLPSIIRAFSLAFRPRLIVALLESLVYSLMKAWYHQDYQAMFLLRTGTSFVAHPPKKERLEPSMIRPAHHSGRRV
jgi:hypothetical protein